jgi:Helicase
LETQDALLPVTIQREQFPIIPAFAMTINKSQGQTIDRVGIYLNDVVFAHGQLYVACSRSRLPQNICIYIRDQGARQGQREQQVFTRNVIFREVFQRLSDPINYRDPVEALTDREIMDMVEMAEEEIYSPDLGSVEEDGRPALEDEVFTPLHLQVSDDAEELEDHDYRINPWQDQIINNDNEDEDDDDDESDSSSEEDQEVRRLMAAQFAQHTDDELSEQLSQASISTSASQPPIVNAPATRDYPARRPYAHILRRLGPNWQAISELCASWDFPFATQADMIEQGDIASLFEAYEGYLIDGGRQHSPF